VKLAIEEKKAANHFLAKKPVSPLVVGARLRKFVLPFQASFWLQALKVKEQEARLGPVAVKYL
jgi:hypothetical protein